MSPRDPQYGPLERALAHTHDAGPARGLGRRPRLLAVLVPLLVPVLVACAPEPAPPTAPGPGAQAAPSWPEGTAFAVSGHPVLLAEVDHVAGWTARILPASTPLAWRREALEEHLLPTAVLAAAFPAAREAARAAAVERLTELRTTGAIPPDADAHAGTFRDVGLVAFGEVPDLEDGAWGGPYEDQGRWLLLHRRRWAPAPAGEADQFEIDVIEFPFTPDGFRQETMEATIDASRLDIVDPDLRLAIPTIWRDRMRGERPTTPR